MRDAGFEQAYAAYVEALLGLSFCYGTVRHDDCDGEGCGSALATFFEPVDLAPSAAADIREDLVGFIASCIDDRPAAFAAIPWPQVGHDFFLTRCGHGAGFWDRGLGELGDWLTDRANRYGEQDAYVGDDGRLYV